MNILVITSEYPNPNSDYDTPIVHYFVKQWIEIGHQVRVIHTRSVFPRVFYLIARTFESAIKKFFKTDFIPVKKLEKPCEFKHDNVDIVSAPIFKFFPHVRFLNLTIQRFSIFIYNYNKKKRFSPDYIVCHFLNPQLQLIPELKKLYPGIKTSLVIHENPVVINKTYGKRAKKLLDQIDFIGFRFQDMMIRFISVYGTRTGLFLCPSGICEEFILNKVPYNRFRKHKIMLTFVGMLIPLKNVDILIESVYQAFPEKNFMLNIIGKGFLENELKAMVERLGLVDCVCFFGHIPRNEVQDVISDSDIFVMVSNPEAFGLVYLEAMSKGCLTIGTRGQGIDGVIQDGYNGFLCGARDIIELRDILKNIQVMSYEKKLSIASNALSTARGFTDAKVALAYLENINALPSTFRS